MTRHERARFRVRTDDGREFTVIEWVIEREMRSMFGVEHGEDRLATLVTTEGHLVSPVEGSTDSFVVFAGPETLRVSRIP